MEIEQGESKNTHPGVYENPEKDIEHTFSTKSEEEKDPNFFQIIWDIIYSGFLGAVVFLVLASSITILNIFAGRLKDAEIAISAMGVVTAWLAIGSSLIFGINSGYNVLIGRCYGLKDLVALNNFRLRQWILVNFVNIILLVYTIALYYLFENMYAHNVALRDYSQIFLIISFFALGTVYNIDVYRQTFIGMQVFVATFQLEVLTVTAGAAIAWYCCFTLEFEFYGLAVGCILGQIIGLAGYAVYFNYSKDFEKLHKKVSEHKQLEKQKLEPIYNPFDNNNENALRVENKPLLGDQIPKRSVLNSQVENEEPPMILNSSGDKLKSAEENDKGLHTWSGLLTFESTYFIIMFLELFWVRFDTILASFYFSQTDIAVQSALMNSVMIMDCFSYGFAIATSSGISRYIVQGKVRLSIKFSLAATIVSVTFGLLFASSLYIYSDALSKLLINDPKVQLKLAYMQRFYCGLIPIQLCQGVMYAVIRSIKKQHLMIYCQVVANYCVHFSVYFMQMFYTDTDHNEIITYSVGSTYLVMNVCGIVIAVSTNWPKIAREIQSEMKNDELINEKLSLDNISIISAEMK